MTAYLSINRFDIMNLFLLGYLCLCVVINPIESSDWETGFPEISERYVGVENCTQCADMQKSCLCYNYIGTITDKCLICCPDVLCCTCFDCALCGQEERQLIIMTQIVISILFGFGIIGLIIVYCKICHRTRQAHRRQRIVLQEERDLTTRCSTIEDLRERPPSYNEVVRSALPVYTSSRISAPPLYTSPYNRTSMQEAPPSYPGTPKPQEKSQDFNEPPFSPPFAQYM